MADSDKNFQEFPSYLEGAASATLPAVQQQQQNKVNPATILQALQSMMGGGASGTGPMVTPQTAMPQPRMPQQGAGSIFQGLPSPIAQGEFATSGGRKRAEADAVYQNLSGLVSKATEYYHQKKVQDAASLYTTTMTAMQGLQEGQAAGNQQMVEQNQRILNSIFDDPKKRKMLEKGFDVKLMGDDKGKAKAEYQGLQTAMKDWNAKGRQGLSPIAQKFQGSMPMTMGMNPALAAQAELIKRNVIPGGKEQLAAQTEILKTIQTSMDKGFDRQSKEAIADKLAAVKDTSSLRQYYATLAKVMGAQNAAQVISESRVKAASIHARAITDSAQWHAAGQILSKTAGAKAQDAQVKQLSLEAQRIMDQVKSNQTALDNLSKEPFKLSDPFGRSRRAEALRGQNELLKNQFNAVINQMNRMNLGEDLQGGQPPNNQPGGAGTQDSGSSEFDSLFNSLLSGEESPD